MSTEEPTRRALLQGASIHELPGVVGVAHWVLSDHMQAWDITVRPPGQERQRPAFPKEPLGLNGPLGLGREVRHLDCDPAFEEGVPRLVDSARGAPTEFADDLVEVVEDHL